MTDPAFVINRPSAPRPASQLAAIAILVAVLSVDLTPIRFPELAPGRWVVFVALSIVGVLAGRTIEFSQARAPERLLIAAFGWVLLVAPLSPTPWRSTVLAAALAGTAMVGLAVGRRVRWRDLQAATVAGSTVVLAVAAVLGNRSADDGRWMGLSEEANALGAVGAIAVVMGASMMAHRNWLGFPAVALGSLTLFQTSAAIPSSGAALGMAVVAAPVLGRLQPRLRAAVPILIAVLYAVAAATVATLDAEQLGSQGEKLKDLNRRTDIWSFLAERIADRPMTGYGPWGSHDLLAVSVFDGRVDWGPTHGHNALVELATMGGLPAAGLFLAAIVATAWRLTNQQHACIAVAIALIAMSMTEHLVGSPSIALFLMGAVVGASGSAATREVPTTSDTAEDTAPSSLSG